MAAIRLEDLLQAQQDLKKKDEKQRVESMSVEDFRLMSKELSDSKDSRTTKSIIKKGMIDKTGDGLNSNVIKMVQLLKETTKQKGNIIGPVGPATVEAAPVAPVGPVAPVDPVTPVGPTAPVGPVGPVAPEGPVEPVGP